MVGETTSSLRILALGGPGTCLNLYTRVARPCAPRSGFLSGPCSMPTVTYLCSLFFWFSDERYDRCTRAFYLSCN